MMAEVAWTNATAGSQQATAHAMKSGIETIVSMLHSTAQLQGRLDDNNQKLKLRTFYRGEAGSDPRHCPKTLVQIDEDIKRLKEEQQSLIREIEAANDKLADQYSHITTCLITEHVTKVKEEIKDETMIKAREQTENLAKLLRAEIAKGNSAEDIPRLSKELEIMSKSVSSMEVKLKSELQQLNDERKNALSADIGNVFRKCAALIEEANQANLVTSDNHAALVKIVDDLRKSSARISELDDVKDSVRRLNQYMNSLATIDKVDRMERTINEKQGDDGRRMRALAEEANSLRQKMKTIETQTTEYNRRSSELDIVYERIKSHIESLRKESDKAPPPPAAQSVSSGVSASDLAEIRVQISELSSKVHKTTSTGTSDKELKDLRVQISKLSTQLTQTEQNSALSSDLQDVRAQISKLSAQVTHIPKVASSSVTARDLDDMRTQISKLSTQLSQSGQISNQRSHPIDSTASNPEIRKTLSYLEARMIVLEQSYKMKMDDLELEIFSLGRKRRASDDQISNPKRLRTDDPEAMVIQLKQTADEQSAKLNEVLAFLEPLRATVLGDQFITRLQNSLNQIINVARRHESDIEAVHGVLERIVGEKKMENRLEQPAEENDAQQVFKLELDTHKRKAEEKHEQLFDHIQNLKNMYTKSQEKEIQQQVQIDKLNQQLTSVTFMMNRMCEALTKNGIIISQASDSNVV